MYFNHIPTPTPLVFPVRNCCCSFYQRQSYRNTYFQILPLSHCVVGQLHQIVKPSFHQWYETHSPPKLGIKDKKHLGQVCLLGCCVFWHTLSSKRIALPTFTLSMWSFVWHWADSFLTFPFSALPLVPYSFPSTFVSYKYTWLYVSI